MENVVVERNKDEVTITVEVPQDAIKKKEAELLKTIAGEVRVPGFRPGKAPRNVLLSRYGEKAFFADLREEIAREWLHRVLDDADLEPVTTPKVETVEFTPGEKFVFRAMFAVLPAVEIPADLKITVTEPPPAEVKDEEVVATLTELRRQAATLEPKGGPAEVGDVVHIRRDDHTWQAEVGEAPLSRQLIGVKAGERVVLRDEEGHAEEFEVAEVYRLLVPEPEEAARHYGYESWDAMMEDVRAKLLRRAEQERAARLRITALDALADALAVEPPVELLAEVVDDEMREIGAKRELRAEVETTVRRRLRREIIAHRLAEREGLLPSDEEVERLASQAGETPGTVRARLVFERAADWILTNLRRS